MLRLRFLRPKLDSIGLEIGSGMSPSLELGQTIPFRLRTEVSLEPALRERILGGESKESSGELSSFSVCFSQDHSRVTRRFSRKSPNLLCLPRLRRPFVYGICHSRNPATTDPTMAPP